MKRRLLLFLVASVFISLIISMIFSYYFTNYSHEEKFKTLNLITDCQIKISDTKLEFERLVSPESNKEKYSNSLSELRRSFSILNNSLQYNAASSYSKNEGEVLAILSSIQRILSDSSLYVAKKDSVEENISFTNSYRTLLDSVSQEMIKLRKTYSTISEIEEAKLKQIQLISIVSTNILILALLIWLYIYVKRVNNSQSKILESQERYKSIFMNSPLGIFHYNYHGAITEFNDKFVEILSSSREKLLGLNMLTQIKDKKLIEQVKKSLDTGSGYYEDEYESITSGKKIYAKIILKGIRDEYNRITTVIGVVEDISEMKVVEQNLTQSLEHNTALISAMPDLLFEFSDEGIFENYNAQTNQQLYLPPEKFLGKNVREVFDESLADLTMEKIKTTLAAGKMQIYEYPLEINGETHYFESRMVKSGKKSVLAIIRDITENKRAAEMLRASRERYEAFINETHEGIYRIEFSQPIKANIDSKKQAELFYKHGYIAECNNAFLKMYGAKLYIDIIGKSIEEFHDLESYPENFNQTVELMENGFRVENQKTTEVDQAGNVHYFSNNAFGIVENGYLVRIWGTQRDITKLVEAEEEKKILYRALEQSQVSIIITDLNGDIEYVNPKFESVTGYTFDEVYGKNPRFLRSGLDDGTIHKDLWSNIAKGENWTGIFHNKKKNGELFFESATISPITDEDGNIRHYVAVKEDITELTKAQLELKNYKEYLEQLVEKRTEELNNKNIFLRTLIDTIPNPVFVKNREGKYTDVNKAFVELFGIGFNDIIGEDIRKIGDEEVTAQAVVADELLLKDRGKLVYETFMKNSLGSIIPLMVYKASFGPPNEEPEGIAGMIIDITESKKTQEQMHKALEQEKELNEMKTNFISLASHELRTPLTAIYSSTELLERYGSKWSADKFNSHIARIKYSVENLTDLMEDMLTLSRVDTGKIVFNPRSLPLKMVINQNINSLELLKSDNHKLDVNFSLNNEYYILDEKLVKYIVQNLLSNGIKYSPKGGRISIDVWDDDSNINIVVKDEGIGIHPDEIENVFEPFHRGKNVSNISGTGLGLSIVKEAVDLHDGEINVTSEPDKGTTFEIILPIIK